jgi:uncharacterized membrane protein YhdT
MSLLRVATWSYALSLLLVLGVAVATVRPDELPGVLLAVPMLWMCARLAQEGRRWSIGLGAVAVPLWWVFATHGLPGSHSDTPIEVVLVFELGIVPLAALGLGAAALGAWVAACASRFAARLTGELTEGQRAVLVAKAVQQGLFARRLRWLLVAELAVATGVAATHEWPLTSGVALVVLFLGLELLRRRHVTVALALTAWMFKQVAGVLGFVCWWDEMSALYQGGPPASLTLPGWEAAAGVLRDVHLIVLAGYLALQSRLLVKCLAAQARPRPLGLSR